MAEVKKKFSQLDPGSVPFDGMETIAAVQGGITKHGTISGIHGAGWWEKLKAAFVDFVAPEALHANDADTLGGETSAELHNAGALTGTAPLSVIPAELTGKNAATATRAATATSAAKLTNARAINGVLFDGSANITVADSTKAPLASPALTGSPTAPTPATATNNTQIATTAFVKAQLLAVIYPIGCYYTQYPNANSNVDATEFPVAQRPATLFGGTWEEQWANESIFFRTKGTLSDLNRTNGKQEDQMQQITGGYSAATGGGLVGSFNGAISRGSIASGSMDTNPDTYGFNFDSANSPNARTGTETRSVNRRIKVWKRTA